METLTAFKAPLLAIAAAAGICFIIGGGIDLSRRKNTVASAAYVAGGTALAAIAVALLTGWRPGDSTEYGPADPAAPMIRELMDEIRNMEAMS